MVLAKPDVHLKKNEVGFLSPALHKINSKCTTDLSLKPYILKPLEVNTGATLQSTGIGKNI